MYIDYATLIYSTTQPDESLDHLKYVVQTETRYWNDGLHTSGGKLNGKKTDYYLLIWNFHQDGTPYIETEINSETPVTLCQQGSEVTLQQLWPDKAEKEFKSLGVQTAGTLSEEYELR